MQTEKVISKFLMDIDYKGMPTPKPEGITIREHTVKLIEKVEEVNYLYSAMQQTNSIMIGVSISLRAL